MTLQASQTAIYKRLDKELQVLLDDYIQTGLGYYKGGWLDEGVALGLQKAVAKENGWTFNYAVHAKNYSDVLFLELPYTKWYFPVTSSLFLLNKKTDTEMYNPGAWWWEKVKKPPSTLMFKWVGFEALQMFETWYEGCKLNPVFRERFRK